MFFVFVLICLMIVDSVVVLPWNESAVLTI